ncbi:hypothetical protein [Robertmurraya massiliosenegalensis]|uniref:hypothetical protein n=1 Tax=Robertmurraya massiliosenegalensis TaxID=1287657 RepID=UPI000313FC13|nr:hypothetical protein [Robertmurraya massiliosenegalensis]
MTKNTIRAFALGIILAVALLQFTVLKQESDISLHDAKEKLTEEGFVILTNEEFTNLEAVAEEKELVEEEKTKPNVNEEEKLEESPTEETAAFTLVIEENMSTKKIANILAGEKIIDDATEFEQFLIDHDYHTKVQIGNFELNSDMDYEEISKIITKNK